MSARAANFAVKVENFQHEITEEVHDVQLRIEAIRKKIADNLGTDKNFSGFLLGHVDDFLNKFDDQVIKLDKKLASDLQYWLTKAKEPEENKGQQTDGITQIIAEFQSKMAQFIYETPPAVSFELKNFPIKDLQQFGQSNDQKDVDFRWPTEVDLEGLNL